MRIWQKSSFEVYSSISFNEDRTETFENSDLNEFYLILESLKIPHYCKEYMESELSDFILDTVTQYIDDEIEL